jgi:hypothetical protein
LEVWTDCIFDVKEGRSRSLKGVSISWRYGLTAYLMSRKEGADVVKEFVK